MGRLLFVLLLGMLVAAPVLGQQTAAVEKSGKDVDSLLRDLKDNNSTIRANAAEALGKINDSRVVDPLIYALHDRNSSVRQNAVLALDSLAGGSLIQSLKDKDIEVRKCAIYKLGSFGVNGLLIQVLKDQTQNSTVRVSAAFALGSLGNEEAVEPLIQALNDTDPNVRAEAAIDLGDIGDKRAVEPLIRALKDDNSRVRDYASQGLGEINNTRSDFIPGETHSRESSMAADYCTISFPQNLSLSINISSINPDEAAAGNSNSVNVHFDATRFGFPIFGLRLADKNFELDALKVPPQGPEVVSKLIGLTISNGIASNYEIAISPATYQGKQYTWVAGTYTVKLHCINAGKELANKTFSFSVRGNATAESLGKINDARAVEPLSP